MGTRVSRSTLFGIPLQQHWSYANSGDFAPTYYLQSDAPLYYYSFTDACTLRPRAAARAAGAFRSDDHRVQPCDYGVDHIRRVLTTFPGVFSGIGEFSIHKEFVSAKIPANCGHEPSARLHPRFCRRVGPRRDGLDNDIDMPFAKEDAEPVYLTQMKSVLRRHPKTTIIWAHVGLGRIVHPVRVSAEAAERNPTQIAMIEAMLTDLRSPM